MGTKRALVSDDEYDDDGDFVDELSEEEDVKPGEGGGNPFAKVLRGSLNIPLYTNWSTKTLHELLHMGNIELNPAYQREVVWPETKMRMLIQSLFLNYYIPPLIFAVEPNEVGEEVRTCIDGKQRCTSILHFMDGKIPFVSPATKERFWYRKFGTAQGKELPAPLRRRFDAIQLQAVEYRGITDEQQRDVFQRVQMGVSLSAAEKLQAIPGPWTNWILNLQKMYVAEENGNLGNRIEWDTKRARPFQNLVSFIVMAFDTSLKVLPTAAAMHSFLERADPPDAHFRRKVEEALGLMVNIAINYHEVAFKSMPQKIAPVEFCFAALVIYRRMGIFSAATIAQWIGKMRVYIRVTKGFIDIRSNNRVAGELAHFVDAIPKIKPPGEIPAAEEFANDDVDPRDVRAAKRARRNEDEDPTYRGPAIARDLSGTGTKSLPARTTAAPRMDVPSIPAVRPPANSMDRPGPSNSNSYNAGYQNGDSHAQQSSQAYSSQQNSQSTRAPALQYTPAQLAHFHAMQNAQQHGHPSGNRWNS